ncbi:hypothetical protein VPH35_005067 [Triticum aestivum]|uniref:Uncharacterized protein n=2 Tax=Triticum TaxID=4564 RepID=A0A9R0V097_TRITD|nr:uncharacterized protein LOC123069243 isoform X1 [Triticum aestivum]XP_044347993.1 uncharacterized protein LOC123069243 isoform X1 [Triticum aestivum]XP_044348002.1 uncharacterized protein LOC123069243 isoform X1 [Triticum aestivum]VAH11152.1 unnamed protein product [Triticum turgidum subsp. durum]
MRTMPWKGHHDQEQDDALEGSPIGATTYGLVFSTNRDIDMEVRHGRPGARHGGSLLSLPLPLLCWLVGRKTTARQALLLPPLLPSHHSATDAMPSTEGVDANTLRMVIGAIYTTVMFVGINNCATVQPIVLIERTTCTKRGLLHCSATYAAKVQVLDGSVDSENEETQTHEDSNEEIDYDK